LKIGEVRPIEVEKLIFIRKYLNMGQYDLSEQCSPFFLVFYIISVYFQECHFLLPRASQTTPRGITDYSQGYHGLLPGASLVMPRGILGYFQGYHGLFPGASQTTPRGITSS
jgi:hypothetical protein